MSILSRNISSFFFFAVLILLISISILSYQTITRLVRSYDWVSHTHLVKSHIKEAESFLKDAETAQLGFSLTLDSTFLDPINGSFTNLTSVLSRLDSLVADNEEQLKNVEEFRRLSLQRFYNIYGILHISTTRKLDNESSKNLLDHGRLFRDSLRTLSAKMISIEDQLLTSREEQKNRSAFVTPKLALFFILVSLGFVLMSFFKIRHELYNQQQIRQELKEKNEELMQLNTELVSVHKLNENAELTANLGNFVWNLSRAEITPTKNFFHLIEQDPLQFDPTFENITALVADEDQKSFLEGHRRIEEGGELVSMIFRIRSGSGKLKHIKSTGVKLRNAVNEDVIAGSWQDITELIGLNEETRKLNQQLILQNETFRHAEAASLQGSYRWNLSSGQIYYSENLYRLFDCEPNEFPPSVEAFFEFIHPDDVETVRMLSSRSQRDGRVFPIQYRLVTRKGWVKHVKTSGRKIISNGEIILIGSLQDISHDVAMAENLHSREVQLSEALSIGRLGSWEANFEKRKLTWSDEMYRLFGYEPGEIDLDMETYGGVLEEDIPLINAAIEESISTGKTLDMEYRRIDKYGQIRFVYSKGVLQRDRRGRPVGMVGINMDITPIRKSEQLLQRKNKELENRNAELASFNYIASHDLQEPLRKIITFAKMIKDREPLTDKGSDYFNRIVSASFRMQNLIDSLLNLSLINTGETRTETTDLNIILTEVLRNNHERIDELAAKVNAHTLPVLDVNALQIQQLFDNLISNSLKYARNGTPPEIEVYADVVPAMAVDPDTSLKQNFWKITFKDNGIGFDNVYRHKIFELFQRLHGKSEYTGTGIGLAICRKIVQNHNGFITAEGEPGKGAQFHIYLPTH